MITQLLNHKISAAINKRGSTSSMKMTMCADNSKAMRNRLRHLSIGSFNGDPRVGKSDDISCQCWLNHLIYIIKSRTRSTKGLQIIKQKANNNKLFV